MSAPSLKAIIEEARRRTVVVRPGGKRYRATLDDLTALTSGNDPFRLDTPANHRDGAWFGDLVGRVERRLHCRGFHYAAIGAPMPDGTNYVNTEKCWIWIQKAAAAARWLGFCEFNDVTDERNAEPVWRPFERPHPRSYFTLGGVEIQVPSEITPDVMLYDFRAVQPFNIALFGEKTSLEPVLGPLARRYEAHLLLPTGEASSTMCKDLAELAAEDGRPLAIFYFSDCDPAGWQMCVSVARKMQALQARFYPELEWSLVPVALTPAQVREHDLPSDPMKDTEKRAAAWTAAYGVEQTEIDALATLQPDVLEGIATDAIDPYCDDGLAAEAWKIKREWEQRARMVLESQVGEDQLEQLRAEAEAKIEELREEVDALNDAMRIPDLDGVQLPDLPDLPEPQAEAQNSAKACQALISSEWSWVDQTRALIDHKTYGTASKHIEDPDCENCGAVLVDLPPNARFCDRECGKEWRERRWPR